mmetsp:Transcript_41589/g.81583  ORF Transcript_41589/g.81583 Transcript_41589/m.81583 type:complete len:84 (+) Transcript_41589:2789-3040(+)
MTGGEGYRSSAALEVHGPGVQTHCLVVPHTNDGCVLVCAPAWPLHQTCTRRHDGHVSGTSNIYHDYGHVAQSAYETGNMMMRI